MHDTIGPVPLTEAELVAWGERIGASVAVPVVFALRGELGAGKSVLARAIARGVDVWHLDLYRLDDPDDVWELGWRELGTGDDIVVIEWPERAEALLPRDRWDVHIEMTTGSDGERSKRLVRAVRRGDAPALPAPGGGE